MFENTYLSFVCFSLRKTCSDDVLQAITPAQLTTQYRSVNVSSINDLVKGGAAQKNPHTLAFREVAVLQGVSATAVNALKVLTLPRS
jgi:hypothetical protein